MRQRCHQRVLIGVDVQAIDDVQRSVADFGDRYLDRVYTNHELDSCRGEPGVAAGSLAARFAAKEAVMKVLDAGDESPEWRSIEVRRRGSGQPEIVLYGTAAELARRKGVEEFSVSLSHDGGVAVATVIAMATRRGRDRR